VSLATTIALSACLVACSDAASVRDPLGIPHSPDQPTLDATSIDDGGSGDEAGDSPIDGSAGKAGSTGSGGSGAESEPDGGEDSAHEDGGSDAGLPPRDRVLHYLQGISGTKTLSGIHNRHNTDPDQYTGQIHDVTGKYPAMWSGDFLFEQQDIDARQGMIDQAKTEWSHGAVVGIMYHACPPTQGESCGWDGGVLSHLSDAQWSDLVTDGGELNAIWKNRLEIISPFLQQLKDAGVAPLFRPLHEMNQGAFWWGGRPGPNGTRRLFQLTHDYLVGTKGLDNLLWVWDVQDLSWDFDQYDPGPGYYDIAALDVYGDGFTQAKYDAMVEVAGGNLIAIGECARLPRAWELDSQSGWTFFMSWSELTFSDNTGQEIVDVYTSPKVLTLDEMPGWD
jgi:mannan endo-1,4-beta-mannosidase